MADLSFKVAARRKEPVTFTLEGSDHVYTFNPPKQAVAFMPLLGSMSDGGGDLGLQQTKAVFAWLDKGLSEEDQDHIESRLRDEDDDLDFDTLGEVAERLLEKVAGRPTT